MRQVARHINDAAAYFNDLLRSVETVYSQNQIPEIETWLTEMKDACIIRSLNEFGVYVDELSEAGRISEEARLEFYANGFSIASDLTQAIEYARKAMFPVDSWSEYRALLHEKAKSIKPKSGKFFGSMRDYNTKRVRMRQRELDKSAGSGNPQPDTRFKGRVSKEEVARLSHWYPYRGTLSGL